MFRLPSAGNAQLILMFRDRLRRDLRLRDVFDGGLTEAASDRPSGRLLSVKILKLHLEWNLKK
jgi:hypothetical protein